ncbi:hypothetical protein D9Q98_005749 [Chlorella vulgaris]|uniref:Uncharacterized protein n=1 Tax=Chlorella vulgaris TaxID=3077 RepID=A0A9D4TMG7_CHLVU|nr:hypothetical protein D9Q98_005749 [Chlorella vulgaris]
MADGTRALPAAAPPAASAGHIQDEQASEAPDTQRIAGVKVALGLPDAPALVTGGAAPATAQAAVTTTSNIAEPQLAAPAPSPTGEGVKGEPIAAAEAAEPVGDGPGGAVSLPPVVAVAPGPQAEAEGAVKQEASPSSTAEPAPEVKAEAAVKQEAAAALAATPPLEPPSDQALLARLRQLLTEVDLATTTEKQLRRRLEGEYGLQLGDRKALLRDAINAYLEEAEEKEGQDKAAADDDEEEEEEMGEEAAAPAKRKRKAAGSSLGSFLSPEMEEFLGVARMPRTQVVKQLWVYIKEHNLQDPKDKRTIIYDDKLKKLFPGTKCSMFKLQKHLSKHCKTSDVVGGSDSEEEDAEGEEDEGDEQDEEQVKPAKRVRSAPSASRRRSTSSAAASGGEEKARKPGGFTKECKLSPEMAAWMGSETASRPAVTKHFWAYCKQHELQDPTDRSYILADETLQALTGGEKRFKGFSFSKFTKQHFKGYADA